MEGLEGMEGHHHGAKYHPHNITLNIITSYPIIKEFKKEYKEKDPEFKSSEDFI